MLGLDDSTAGLLAGAYGLGLAIGGVTQTGLAHRRRLAPVVLAGALLFGLAELAVAFLGSLAPAFVMLALAGLGVSLVLVSSRTLLQRGTDRLVLARVLAVQEGVHLMGLTLGAVVGPIAVIALGPQLAFLPFGLFIIAVGLLSFPAIRSHGRLRPASPARGRAAVQGALPRCAARPMSWSTWPRPRTGRRSPRRSRS